MVSKEEKLSQLRDYIKDVNNDVTLILQRLQWDKNTLLQNDSKVSCKYDKSHRILPKNQKEHEDKCFLKSHGYKPDDLFLPEPFDPHAKTLVKFTPDEIKQIINTESKKDPLFRRGNGSLESQPLTLGRLAATYTVDERRAIYDAVVTTMPSVHDLSDLALPSSSSDATGSRPKSRLEVLAELRDMRRRRTRYRVSAPAKNYSHTLRELIATQMEMYTGMKTEVKIEQNDEITSNKTRNGIEKEDIHLHAHEGEKNKINERENFKHRHHVREEREREYNKQSRHSDKHRHTSHLTEGNKIYNKHNEGKRQRDYKDSYRDRSNSSSTDRKRHSDESDRNRCRERSTDNSSSKYRASRHDRIDSKRYRDKSADKYRSNEKYRYYDYGYEKEGKHRGKK